MSKFEFKKNSVTLNICGNIFDLVLTNEIIAECDRLKYEANDFVAAVCEAKDAHTAKQNLEKTCDFLVAGIENILGAGSVKKVFGDKPITLLDLTDVVVYIRAEIMTAIANKTAEYHKV